MKCRKVNEVKILSVRLGFACNSSSSHSLAFIEDGPLPKGRNDCGNEFGWEDFILVGESKRAYVAAQVFENVLRTILSEDWAKLIIRSLFGISEWSHQYSYVDHQSLWTLPVYHSGALNLEFIRDLEQFIMQERLVIYGGNDNEPWDYQQIENPKHFNFPFRDTKDRLIARKDKAGWWSLFNRETGAKIRMTFDTGMEFTPTHSSAPELVDVKITDFCKRECPFCYQGSNRNGKHADMVVIHFIAHHLSELGCFEAAIGGGEPMSHPQIIEILQLFRTYGIVPNITTADTKWLENRDFASKVFGLCGGIAFSVENCDIFAQLASLPKTSVQVVEGVMSTDKLSWILHEAWRYRVPVTILGFKSVGRGAGYKTVDCDVVKAIDGLFKNQRPRISVDTVIADKYYERLVGMGVNPILLEREDGSFSMYIDAVAEKAGRSSYSSKLIDAKAWELEEAFNRLQGEEYRG